MSAGGAAPGAVLVGAHGALPAGGPAAARPGYAERALRYARAVLAGEVVACKWIKAAAQRQLDDLARAGQLVDGQVLELEARDAAQADPDWPYYFDAAAGAHVCQFIELLPHVKGEWARPTWVNGLPRFPTIVLEDWQVFFLVVLFGWKRSASGLRRFVRAYLEVARKNAKSTLAAGVALYMLAADGEPGAEVYSAATKKDQARIVWDVARQMVARERDFADLGVGYNARAIVQESTGSKYEPIGRDSDTQDGLNVHCFVSDELHAQNDRGLYDVLDSATGARQQALGLGITTAGYNTAGVCYEQRTYLSRILNSVLHAHGGMGYRIEGNALRDEAYFGLIYTLDTGYAEDPETGEAPPDDDWSDPAVWIKANPNLGVSVLIEGMLDAATKARGSTQSQKEFRTKRCNQWLASESGWMDLAKWRACGDARLTEAEFAGEECWLGLDAAFKTDLFAKVKLFKRGERFYVFGRYWLPEAVVFADGNDHFRAWAEEGLIEVADGAVVDVEPIKDALRADADQHVVREIAFDPAQLTQFATEMIDDGFEMVEIRPTVLNFSEPMKIIGELVKQGRLAHNGDPVLEWMVGNVVFHKDAKDNIYPRKAHDGDKIDGVVALIMAIARAIAGARPIEVGIASA